MIYSLQFLRFIAASFVVLSHSDTLLGTTGAFGVDIFFVISGFVIYFITQKDQSGFFVKRLIRIVPMYWLFTLGLVAVTFVAPSFLKGVGLDLGHLLTSLFFVPHWTLPTMYAPFLRLGWTLNFEMIFYLIFLSMTLSHKYRGIICAAIILAIILILNNVTLAPNSPLHFYAWSVWAEFIFGLALARIWIAYGVKFQPLISLLIAGVGILLLVYLNYNKISAITLGDATASQRYIIWGIPAVLVVVGALGAEDIFANASAQAKRLFLWLGELSYPVYLIHLYIVLGLQRVIWADINPLLLFVLSLTISTTMAAVVSRFFDQPIRKALRAKFLRS